MDGYIEILRDWERRVADPAVYERLDVLLPDFAFRRVGAGGPKDHWASRYKVDLTLPKRRTAEKTVVYKGDMRLREQGNWSEAEGVMDRIMRDNGFPSVYEAYQLVSRVLGLDMPRPDSREVAEAVSRSERRSALLSALADYFVWNLQNNRSAKAARTRSYLRQGRGFSKEDIERFRFGFVPEWGTVIRHITLDRGYSLEDLDEACGVRNAEGYTAVGRTHVLAVPYVCGGELKGFLFRRVEEGSGPKYIATADLDRKSVFFNMPSRHDVEDILVVEGEFDALKATAAGIPDVVAIGGSDISGERRRQVEDAFRRGVKRIILCPDLDADAEGNPETAKRHQAIMRCVHTIKDVDLSFEEIYIVDFPEPADPDQFIREKGAEAFIALLRSSVPYWEYLHRYKRG